MKTFLEFVNENKKHTLFHGTHKNNIDSFKKNGIVASSHHGERGAVFLTPKSSVAFDFASMGGEGSYLNGSKSEKVPTEDRVVFEFEIPDDWYQEHVVKVTGGYAPEVSFDASVPPNFIKSYKIGKP